MAANLAAADRRGGFASLQAQPELVRFGAVGLAQPVALPASLSLDAAAADLLLLAEQVERATDLAVVVLPLAGVLLAASTVPSGWSRVLAAWSGLRLTTIAALEGTLSFAATTLAAVLDFRVASRGTVLTAYCNGVPGSCLHSRLIDVCGQIYSFELSPTDPIRATDAMLAGLADDLAAPGEAVTKALRFAQRVAASPEAARRMAKLAIKGQELRHGADPCVCPLHRRAN